MPPNLELLRLSHAEKISAYFACSFWNQDILAREFFTELCEGLDFELDNLKNYSKLVPAPRAREMIAHAQCLIAVASRRDELTQGGFLMPRAVEQEIWIAYAMKKPVLIFAEDDVKMDGMHASVELRPPAFSGSVPERSGYRAIALKALSDFRSDVLQDESARHREFSSDYVSRRTICSLTLRRESDRYIWHNRIEKQIEFDRPFEGKLSTSFWQTSDWSSPAGSEPGNLAIDSDSLVSGFKIKETMRRCTGHSCEAVFRVSPKPSIGSSVNYWRDFSSPYLHPLYADEKHEAWVGIDIDDVGFDVHDGVFIAERTDELTMHCTFPPEYNLQRNLIQAFCAKRQSHVNLDIPSETRRLFPKIDIVNGEIRADFTIAYPKANLYYGFAWDLPMRSLR